MTQLINARLILPDDNGHFKVERGTLVFDHLIRAVLTSATNFTTKEGPPTVDEIVDAQGLFVSPGFINLHIHGCNGADTMDATAEALLAMQKFLPSTGVTSFLPTTMTTPLSSIRAALATVRKMGTNAAALWAGGWVPKKREEKTFSEHDTQQAAEQLPNSPNPNYELSITHYALSRVLGANVEGPYISPAYKGAQAESSIRKPSFEEFIADYADVIKIVTIAPEVKGGLELIEKCGESGIVASIGHSAADYETALRAIREHGASHITHLFNAQSGLHHRRPGIVGAALDTDVTVELISDNVHVHPMLQRLIWRAKDHSQIILVTDSLKACGLGDGFYELGGQRVEVKGEVATLEDGTIAASVGTLNRMLAKFRENVGAEVAEVVELVTKNPAQKLGLYDSLGSLEVGKVADLVLFDDHFNIAQVIMPNI